MIPMANGPAKTTRRLATDPAKLSTAPVVGPTDPNEEAAESRDPGRREVHP